MKIGVFGGTFDPPHIGHLIAAEDAAAALSLDRVLFIPAGEPPHKRGRVITDASLRLAMIRAAVADEPRFAVDDRETRRAGPSYTVDTLLELHAEEPGASLFLLVGADQYAELDSWHEADRIRSLCRVAVLDRDGGSGALEADDVRVAVTRIDVSASAIRARVAAGASIRYRVPARVAAIIAETGLYRGTVSAPAAAGR